MKKGDNNGMLADAAVPRHWCLALYLMMISAIKCATKARRGSL